MWVYLFFSLSLSLFKTPLFLIVVFQKKSYFDFFIIRSLLNLWECVFLVYFCIYILSKEGILKNVVLIENFLRIDNDLVIKAEWAFFVGWCLKDRRKKQTLLYIYKQKILIIVILFLSISFFSLFFFFHSWENRCLKFREYLNFKNLTFFQVYKYINIYIFCSII